MTDIDIAALVERLRFCGTELGDHYSHASIFADAADALERLQEQCDNTLKWVHTLQDEVAGLSDGLKSAVEVAWNHGATEWVMLNYPRHPVLKAQHVVHSAPQPTTEGFFAMGDPEKTDLAAEIANMIGKALESGADVEEVKAVLTEALEELEAQGGMDDAEEPSEGENA